MAFSWLMSFLTSAYMLEVSMWVAQLFYFICFVPQIFTNFRVKSGTGMSDLLLVFYFNAYFFLLYYIFGFNLPIAYKIMVPLQTLATVTLIVQRIYYAQAQESKRLLCLYLINAAVFAAVLPLAVHNPMSIAQPFGWCSFLATFASQVPQVVKIHRQKSVAGFSFGFVAFLGLAAFIEFTTAVMAQLPSQTLCGALRGLLMAAIMSLQFIRYR
ncbi:MAG: PQ-loop repeat-containing protein [Candidatus Babeliales bacterium]